MTKRSWLQFRLRERNSLRNGCAAALCAGFALPLVPGCCLVRPPDAKTIYEAGNNGWRTPGTAFETFRVAFGAELTDLEFKSFSTHFRAEQQISYSNYLLARKKLLDSKPYLAFLAKAKIVGGSVISERRHRLTVEAAGRRFEVELVREDWGQIYSGGVLIADVPVDFDQALKFSAAATGKVVTAQLTVPEEDLGSADLSKLTGVRVERFWKIERFGDSPAP